MWRVFSLYPIPVLSELLELSRICLKRLPMINGSLKYCDYHNIKMLLWLYAFNHKWKSLNDCRLKTDKQILSFCLLVLKCLKTENWLHQGWEMDKWLLITGENPGGSGSFLAGNHLVRSFQVSHNEWMGSYRSWFPRPENRECVLTIFIVFM